MRLQCCRETRAAEFLEIHDLAIRHSQAVPGLRQARLEHFEEVRQLPPTAGGGRGSLGRNPNIWSNIRKIISGK
jgi:hypothetical protein